MKMTAVFGVKNVIEQGNVVLEADCELVGMIEGYNSIEDIEDLVYINKNLYERVKNDIKEHGTLYAVNIEGDELLSYECVFFLSEDEEIIIDCMENDDRVMAKVALRSKN